MSEKPDSIWNVDSLHALMDERDRRYEQHFKAFEEAVKLAKQVSDQARGTVNIVGVVSILALLVSFAERFIK